MLRRKQITNQKRKQRSKVFDFFEDFIFELMILYFFSNQYAGIHDESKAVQK